MLDYRHIVDDGRPALWERPKTTRRYLHPPKARKLITLWAEGKIVYGNNDWYESLLTYHEEQAVTVWPAWYKYARKFDYRNAENYIYRDGAPVHGIRFCVGGFDIEEEAFTNAEETPTCFVRFRYVNRAPYPVRERFVFVVRKGSEKQIAYGSPDVYTTYLPEIGEVKQMKPTFSQTDDEIGGGKAGLTLRDGVSCVRFCSEKPVSYDEETGIVSLVLSLGESESYDLTIAIGEGESVPFSYEEEREKTLRFWESQMKRITKLPEAFRNDPEKLRMVKNFTVQFLQCFAKYTGESFTVFRQGGLQRHIWPWDAAPALEAIGRIGDFTAELDEVMSTYFDRLQAPDGEIRNLGIVWASDTACCLYSLAAYCLQKNDPAYWERYRNNALRAFRWIEAIRRRSYEIEGAVGGFYPPLRASDWPEELQHWTGCDTYSIQAYGALIRAAEAFGDPMAQEVKTAYDDYRELFVKTLAGLIDFYGEDPVRIPLTPNGSDLELLSNFYVYIQHAGPMLQLDDLLPKNLMYRVKAWGESIRLYENGLYGKIPGKSGNTHIFYTTAPEYAWFYLFLRRGERAECERIMNSLLRYSMTAEYYMVERYDNRDPYFAPWSPNASGMGRLLNMMLDFYRDPDGELMNFARE